MKIVIPGGTGFLGQLLTKSFLSEGHEVVILSRNDTNPCDARVVPWDGATLGEWAKEIEGADAVINLAGQSVKCLYTDKQIKTLRSSRVKPTQVIGQAIKQANQPPSIWLQMSSAAIYAHSFNTPNDEETGKIGEAPDIPSVWKKIVKLVQDWEEALETASTKNTRKVIMRQSVVMAVQPQGAFNIFLWLCRWGLGGSIAGGKQMISWINADDFVKSIKFLLQNNSIEGPVNICSPHPISQAEYMKVLRNVVGSRFGIPATKWMIELSSYIMQIDSELSLKSRYVVPKVLLDNQFSFQFPDWKDAAKNLYSIWKKIRS